MIEFIVSVVMLFVFIVAALIAFVLFLFICFALPIAIFTPSGVRSTKNTSFKTANICWIHGKLRFDEVVMKGLIYGHGVTYSVYVEPEKVEVQVKPGLSSTKISVYPSWTSHFFIDNCPGYYFNARRVIIFVPDAADRIGAQYVPDGFQWREVIDKLRQAKISREKCKYESIQITLSN